jgi:hypothetical protein
MNGADPTLRGLHLKNMQEHVLADHSGAADTAEPRADNNTTGADSISRLALSGGVIKSQAKNENEGARKPFNPPSTIRCFYLISSSSM